MSPKLTIETLEQGVKYVNNKLTIKIPERCQIPVTLLLTLNIFHTLF